MARAAVMRPSPGSEAAAARRFAACRGCRVEICPGARKETYRGITW